MENHCACEVQNVVVRLEYFASLQPIGNIEITLRFIFLLKKRINSLFSYSTIFYIVFYIGWFDHLIFFVYT